MNCRHVILLSALLTCASASARPFTTRIQAHRGGAGLYPENTIEAMKNAVDTGVDVLEMDVQVSKDFQAVVSHDPYFHFRYSTRPDGREIGEKDEKVFIYEISYDSVRKYDVGRKPVKEFPRRKCVPAHKPLLGELLDSVEAYSARTSGRKMTYSVELKSKKTRYEGKYRAPYKWYADLTVTEFRHRGIEDRLIIQSFDTRALEYMHERYPAIPLVYLVNTKDGETMDDYLARLSFTPAFVSPKNLDRETVKEAHRRGMKAVPWGCNSAAEFARWVSAGADAVMTNYPDSAMIWKEQYIKGKLKPSK